MERHGEVVCQNWAGGWLRVFKQASQVATIPALCGRWDCRACGHRKVCTLVVASYTGFKYLLDKADKERPALLTLTYAWKRPKETMAQARERLPDATTRRLDWTGHEWLAYITETWSKFTKLWEKETGTRLVYMQTIELTKQGVPHLHAVLMLDPKWEKEDNERAQRLWKAITKDSYQVKITHRGAFHNTRFEFRSNGQALGYVLKYAFKTALSALFRGIRYRHYRRSASWPMADIGDATTFEWVDRDGEFKVFHRAAFRRARARWNYYFNNPVTLENLQKDKPMVTTSMSKETVLGYMDTYVALRQQANSRLQSYEFFSDPLNYLWYQPLVFWHTKAQLPDSTVVECC